MCVHVIYIYMCVRVANRSTCVRNSVMNTFACAIYTRVSKGKHMYQRTEHLRCGRSGRLAASTMRQHLRLLVDLLAVAIRDFLCVFVFVFVRLCLRDCWLRLCGEDCACGNEGHAPGLLVDR